MSVSHENTRNGHQNSANASPGRSVFMNDYTSTDLGRWIQAMITPTAEGEVLAMALDTINYDETNVPTGWPLRYGHLFFGLNDLSVQATLDKDIYIELDIRIRGDEVRPELKPPQGFENNVAAFPQGYTGHHITVGSLGIWKENGRANEAHFLEIALSETPGYALSYGDPTMTDSRCLDVLYDRCFFDTNGVYSEGRYLNYSTYFQQPMLPLNTNQWTHIKIPLGQVFRNLSWVSIPRNGDQQIDWSMAQLRGIYLGLESMGATRTWIEVKNYQVYQEK